MDSKETKEKITTFKVGDSETGLRLDKYVAEKTSISRAFIQRLIRDGQITVNGETVLKSHRMKSGDTVVVTIPEPKKLDIQPEDIPIDILYEDDDLMVISKPAGLVAHPGPGHPSNTLVNALLAHTSGLSSIGGVDRPGIIHRLDRDTSGIMIVAKTDLAHNKLSDDLKQRKIKKTYWALVNGHLDPEEGLIDEPVGRKKSDRKKMAVDHAKGRQALTRYKVLEEYNKMTLLEVKPETGRTHQIRVHLSHIKHPVVGDSQYGSDRKRDRDMGIERQMLHSKEIEFIHPWTGKVLKYSDELPDDLKEILESLGSKLTG